VASGERRHQLIAQLLGAHRRAIAVARLEQQREHVVAAGAIAATLIDQLVDQPISLLAQPLEFAHSSEATEQSLHGWEQRDRVIGEGQELGQQLAQRLEPRPLLEAEDGAQDHLERQALQARMHRERLLELPRGDLTLGELGHEPRQALHLLPVERRQQELALLEVRVLVEQDHRVAPDDGFEDVGALPGMQDIRRCLEDGLDLLRVGEDHERGLAEQADREALAVARPAALQERRWPAPPADRLQAGGHARTRRQRTVHDVSSSSQGEQTRADDTARPVLADCAIGHW
jgi:hypothetical protein